MLASGFRRKLDLQEEQLVRRKLLFARLPKNQKMSFPKDHYSMERLWSVETKEFQARKPPRLTPSLLRSMSTIPRYQLLPLRLACSDPKKVNKHYWNFAGSATLHSGPMGDLLPNQVFVALKAMADKTAGCLLGFLKHEKLVRIWRLATACVRLSGGEFE
jgi:hypothetical protein